MPHVRLLPDALINQIAAGEVVERPASVVKELLENAVDAGAQRILVSLDAGGRDRVEVADDGGGMEPADAVLALQRHATSKIATAADLEAITTLGFRGEALPSIAAAAHLVLETAAADGAGTLVEVEFGVAREPRPIARPRGTRVVVRDLFLRLPARRKFLRTEATEVRHALAVLHATAFAHPEIALAVEHNGRRILDLPAAPEFGRRLPDLVGAQRARAAVPIAHAHGQVTVSGCLLPPRGSREIVVVVNGRPVRDRLVLSTITRALRAPDGLPEADAFVRIELPGDAVDVNVHPTKAEVRFVEPGRVIAAVAAAIVGARTAMHSPAAIRRVVTVSASPASGQALLPWRTSYETGAGAPATLVREDASSGADWADPPLAATAAPLTARFVGQYRDTYLVLEDAEGLLLVDQHAAHERILFERLLARPGDAPAQRLVAPEVIELSAGHAALAAEVTGELGALGLEVEVVTGNSVRVHAVPAALPAARAGQLVAALLADLAGGEAPGATLRERTAASLSCRAAIKKNTPLSALEAERLLRDLRECREPHRCPHGRPIVVKLFHTEIERRIGRR